MTEAEWATCDEPGAMLGLLYGKASPRKLRLAAAAFCYHVAHLLPADEPCRSALAAAEGYADRRLSRQELAAAHRRAEAAYAEGLAARAVDSCQSMAALSATAAVCWATHPRKRHYPDSVSDNALVAAGWGALPAALRREVMKPADHQPMLAATAAEKVVQASLLRDIVGPLLFPTLTPLPPSVRTWNGGLMKRLAEAAYDHRLLPSGHLDPQRLAVLADALEECGADAALVAHLREPGPHWRGCVALDLILGRS